MVFDKKYFKVYVREPHQEWSSRLEDILEPIEEERVKNLPLKLSEI